MQKRPQVSEPADIPAPLKERLILLAEKYETPSFTEGDPSRVLRRYSSITDTEPAAFIAAMLAFGRRDQFLPKIDAILDEADKSGGPALWLRGGEYSATFAESEAAKGGKKFYRFYSYQDIHSLFDALRGMLVSAGGLGAFFEDAYNRRKAEAEASGSPAPLLSNVISESFPSCPLVPSGKGSANKRVNMFLRWMVRQNSPVDIGIWSWYSPASLVIPLDTHVLSEAIRLGLVPEGSRATLKTALLLTRLFKSIWPSDPCRGDFALFGLGVGGQGHWAGRDGLFFFSLPPASPIL